jgi:hypothetical protein
MLLGVPKSTASGSAEEQQKIIQEQNNLNS